MSALMIFGPPCVLLACWCAWQLARARARIPKPIARAGMLERGHHVPRGVIALAGRIVFAVQEAPEKERLLAATVDRHSRREQRDWAFRDALRDAGNRYAEWLAQTHGEVSRDPYCPRPLAFQDGSTMGTAMRLASWQFTNCTGRELRILLGEGRVYLLPPHELPPAWKPGACDTCGSCNPGVGPEQRCAVLGCPGKVGNDA